MKVKRIYLITMLSLLFVLAACTNSESQSNTITPATLTDREKVILSTVAERAFVFDYKVDNEYEEVSVWVEKYEFGKLVKDQVIEMTGMVEESGSIIFSTSKMIDERNEKIFNIGVGNEKGNFSTINVDEKIVDLQKLSSVWGDFSESKTLNEEMILASIGYSSNEDGVSSFTNDFYDDMEANMDELDELDEYDLAYVLKAKFKKVSS